MAPIFQPEAAKPAPSPPPTHQVPNPAALERPKHAIVVGGCQRACDDARTSLDTFLRGTMRGERETVRRHVNTAALVDRGARFGQRWADAWEAGHLDERTAGIDAWVGGWIEAVSDLSDPEDSKRSPIVTIDRMDDTILSARWRVPKSARSAWAPKELALSLKRRGLEWLVVRIEDAQGEPRDR